MNEEAARWDAERAFAHAINGMLRGTTLRVTAQGDGRYSLTIERLDAAELRRLIEAVRAAGA